MDRSDLQLVVAVRERGSLSAAAAALDLAPPAVTKRLAALEAALGLRLFQRSTRRVSVTPEGDVLYAHAQRLLAGFADLEASLQERQTEPVGTIRIASSFGFGRHWMGPALAQFQARHPRLSVDLRLVDQLPDLAAAGYDGAIWLFPAPAAHGFAWVSRRLARNHRVLVAAPNYLARRGPPAAPADLAQHDCLVVDEHTRQRADIWSLQTDNPRAEPVRVQVSGPLRSNSGELARDWCLAGHGILLRSLWDVAPALADGRLVRVLPPYAMHDADVHWLAPYRPQTPRRVRLLIDFLAERFGAEPWGLSAPRVPPARRRPPSGRSRPK